MSQGRFDIPPDDPFFWGADWGDIDPDLCPFGVEEERRRREAEQETDDRPSWIRETQERRRREREKDGI